MINKLKIFLKGVSGYGNGHPRTNLAKKNIVGSFIIKGLNIAIGLILVPLVINYLEPSRYGIWVTISSIVGWFGFFDIGLGNGLRNRFAEAKANNDDILARKYVSTTYAVLSIVITIVLLLFFVINPFVDWNSILNVDTLIISSNELKTVSLIVFAFFSMQFVLKLVTTVLTADQKPALASVFDLLGKVWSLLIIYILIKTTHGNLIYLSLSLGATPVLVLVLSSLWYYNKGYKKYRPSIRYIDFSKTKDLLNLGFHFFIIQIAAVLLYQTNNIIISHLFGPESVTPYYIAFKYFSILMMVYSIIMTPFWSAITDAWAKKETVWIKRIMNNLLKLWSFLTIVAILMLLLSNSIYSFWVGNEINIPFEMSILVMIWVLMNSWNGVFSLFLNGIGKVKLQMYLGTSAAISNIPIAIYLGNEIGIKGVLIANIIVLSVGVFVYPIQYYRIITNSAAGVWNR